MFKQALFLGIIAGVFAGIAATIYAEVFYWANAYMIDFSSFVTTPMLFGASIFGCVLASIGFWLADKLLAKTGRIIFNLIFTLLSFASILGAFSATLPLDIEFPEMFPSLVVPMHFFPALIWFTLQPLFIKS